MGDDDETKLTCPCCHKDITASMGKYNPLKRLYMKCPECKSVFLPRVKDISTQILQSIQMLKKMMI